MAWLGEFGEHCQDVIDEDCWLSVKQPRPKLPPPRRMGSHHRAESEVTERSRTESDAAGYLQQSV